ASALDAPRGLPLFFFFSSRRRHTRSKRDWSSDVCSSDLTARYSLTHDDHNPYWKRPANLRTHNFAPFAACRRDRRTVARSRPTLDRKSTRLNSSHVSISYAVFCLKKKKPNARNIGKTNAP